MTTSAQTIVIGIFRDRTLAEQAIDELHKAGWSNEQVHLIGQQAGGLLSSLKNAFGSASTSDGPLNNPLFQGLSDEEREQCQHAFEQGNFIVAVSADTHSLEVRDTLHRFGAMNVLLPTFQGGERIIPLRREDVNIQKNTVMVGEVRIHKRIITENKTFTIPVTREEVTIERLPVATQAQEGTFVPPPSDQVSPAPLIGSSSSQEVLSGPSTPPYSQLNTRPADMAGIYEILQEGGSLKILVHEEQVTIQKHSVVVEEIYVHKQVMEETRPLSVPVRHEEAFFERHGNFQVHSDLPDEVVATGTAIPPL